MKLLLLATTMATIFGVAVADSISIRGNYLRQNYEDRLLKKEQAAAETIIQSNQEEEDSGEEIDWGQFAAEIAAEIQAKQEEIDWNSFAADLVSAGLVTTPQPTVNLKTVKPSVSPTQVRFLHVSVASNSFSFHVISHMLTVIIIRAVFIV